MPQVRTPNYIVILTVAAAFAASLAQPLSVRAEGSVSAADRQTNNYASAFIAKGQTEAAIETLIPLVRHNPGYYHARLNLAVAYCNYGLKNRDKPSVLIDYLWRSMALDSSDPIAVKNLQNAVKLLGKDPISPAVHAALAQDCLKSNCLYGAYVEYMEALWLKPDESLTKELKLVEERIRVAPPEEGLNWLAKLALTDMPAPVAFSTGASDIALQTYIRELERKIKQHWNTKSFAKNSNRMKVAFKVKRDGAISNLRVIVSSGDSRVDQAGLMAVQKLGTAPPLPPGSPEFVSIEFSFDYNGLGSAEASRAAILKDLAAKSKELSTLENQGIASKRFLPKKLLEIGEIELLLGNYQKGYVTFVRAVELYKTAPILSRGLLSALAGKADCQQLLGDRKAAINTLSEAFAIAENDLHLKDSEIVSLLELSGKVLYKDNSIPQAEKMFERVRKAKATN
jgi:TonB family protein